MKRMILIGIVIVLMLSGCESEETQPTDVSKDVVIEPKQEQEPEPTPPPETQAPKEPETKVEEKKCNNFDIPSQNLKNIDLTLFTEGLKKTSKGFKFRLIPLDAEGNIIPVTGNLQASFWSTRDNGEKRIKKSIVYTTAFYIKKEDVIEDCSSPEMEISFDHMRSTGRIGGLSEDDPGVIRFEFKRTGSLDLFEKEYHAADFDERIFP